MVRGRRQRGRRAPAPRQNVLWVAAVAALVIVTVLGFQGAWSTAKPRIKPRIRIVPPAAFPGVRELPPWRELNARVPWNTGMNTTSQLLDLAEFMETYNSRVSDEEPATVRHLWSLMESGALKVDTLKKIHVEATSPMENHQFRTGWSRSQWFRLDGESAHTVFVHYMDATVVEDLLRSSLERLTDEMMDAQRLAHMSHISEVEKLRKWFEVVARFAVQFIVIHPFKDGNGRTSRLLIKRLLWRSLRFNIRLPLSEVGRACLPGLDCPYGQFYMSVPRFIMVDARERADVYSLTEAPWDKYEMPPPLEDALDSSYFAAFLVDSVWAQIQDLSLD